MLFQIGYSIRPPYFEITTLSLVRKFSRKHNVLIYLPAWSQLKKYNYVRAIAIFIHFCVDFFEIAICTYKALVWK